MAPVEFLSSPLTPQTLSAIRVEENRLEGGLDSPQAVGTKSFSSIETGLALRSIGYRSVAVPGAPFDAKKGCVPNVQGRVLLDANVFSHLRMIVVVV